jgi:L-amino acid N-acyltransferase YncA
MDFNKKYELANGESVEVKTATISDSRGIINIWNNVVKERIYTMGLNFLSEDEEIKFIESLDERETILIAVLNDKIIGYLLLKIPARETKSTLHVAEVGTWVLNGHRRMGVAHALLLSAFILAKRHSFEKMVIEVRHSNKKGLAFYKDHGFYEVGRFKNQIKIDGKYDDHIMMEKFL